MSEGGAPGRMGHLALVLGTQREKRTLRKGHLEANLEGGQVVTQEEQAARLVWQYGEPIHAVLFFAPETRAATDGLGLKGGWMSYFGCRVCTSRRRDRRRGDGDFLRLSPPPSRAGDS